MTELLRNTNIEKLNIPVQPKAVEHVSLGQTEIHDLRSTLGPFVYAPDYRIQIPEIMVQTIGELVQQNSLAFERLVPRNTEGDSLAYQHCLTPNGVISEPFFQVDMVGMDQDQLQNSTIQRQQIFEFEPSVAMYELIQKFGGAGGLKQHLRENLDILRRRYGKPIALLAPTYDKYNAVLETEFGITDQQIDQHQLSEIVKSASGFDTLFGPDQLLHHFQTNGGASDFLFYVRPSDPLEKIKDPTKQINEPLLSNAEIRKYIRRFALTLNIDNPQWSVNDPRRIKDSKAALVLIGMGKTIRTPKHIASLLDEPDSVYRAKPRNGVFGAYGQKAAFVPKQSDLNWLSKEIAIRGQYILQPEMAPLMVVNTDSGKAYLAMDRHFFSMVSGNPRYMGGIRILNPLDSNNAKTGKLHGAKDMISAPITIL